MVCGTVPRPALGRGVLEQLVWPLAARPPSSSSGRLSGRGAGASVRGALAQEAPAPGQGRSPCCRSRAGPPSLPKALDGGCSVSAGEGTGQAAPMPCQAGGCDLPGGAVLSARAGGGGQPRGALRTQRRDPERVGPTPQPRAPAPPFTRAPPVTPGLHFPAAPAALSFPPLLPPGAQSGARAARQSARGGGGRGRPS